MRTAGRQQSDPYCPSLYVAKEAEQGANDQIIIMIVPYLTYCINIDSWYWSKYNIDRWYWYPGMTLVKSTREVPFMLCTF